MDTYKVFEYLARDTPKWFKGELKDNLEKIYLLALILEKYPT